MDAPQPTRSEINSHESTRLAGACAIKLGPLFRRGVIRRALDQYHATAPELGLDYGLLLLICKYMELRETQYQLFYFICFLLSGGSLFVPVGAILVPLFLFLTILGYLHKEAKEKFTLLPLFHSDNFDPDTVAQYFAIDLQPKLVEGAPLDRQNVLIHRGMNPFVGTGQPIGSWSFSTDISRPGLNSSKPIELFEAAEIYGAIQAAVKRLHLPNLQIRDCLLIHGCDIRHDPTLLPQKLERPRQQIGASELRKIRGVAGSKRRHYKWILIPDWGGEIIYSAFVRCVVEADTLFIEVSSFRLAPIASYLRGIDNELLPNALTVIRWFIGNVLISPFVVVFSIFALFSKIWRAVSEFISLSDVLDRWFVSNSPMFNYGAVRSLREDMAGGLNSYFQKSDTTLFQQTLDREILDTVVDFLVDKGIDVSRLREQQTAILNNGIVITGGNFKAQNIAIGKQAKVAVKKFLAHVSPPSAK